MKLALIRKPDEEYLNGWTCVCLFLSPEKRYESLVLGDYARLDNICSPNECTAFRAIDILQYYPLEQYGQLIGHWASKLRHGASITIGGYDLPSVNHGLFSQFITDEDFNKMVFGVGGQTWQRRQSITGSHHVISVLNSKGLELSSLEFSSDYKFLITGKRP